MARQQMEQPRQDVADIGSAQIAAGPGWDFALLSDLPAEKLDPAYRYRHVSSDQVLRRQRMGWEIENDPALKSGYHDAVTMRCPRAVAEKHAAVAQRKADMREALAGGPESLGIGDNAIATAGHRGVRHQEYGRSHGEER